MAAFTPCLTKITQRNGYVSLSSALSSSGRAMHAASDRELVTMKFKAAIIGACAAVALAVAPVAPASAHPHHRGWPVFGLAALGAAAVVGAATIATAPVSVLAAPFYAPAYYPPAPAYYPPAPAYYSPPAGYYPPPGYYGY